MSVFAGVLLGLSALAEGPDAGFFYDRFPLTLDPGWRMEAAGPLYYEELRDTQRTRAVPPLFSWVHDPDLEMTEFDFFYPALSYDRFGGEYRIHLGQLLSFSGGRTQEDERTRRFTLFPIYFQQRSEVPSLNYTAVFPFYGTIRNRLFRDEIYFIGFPAYARTRRKDLITHNYLYPIVHTREGDQLSGWQVWPLVGFEEKESTTRTNVVDELEIIGGYRKFFALWPFVLKQTTGIGTTNETRQLAVLPAFSTTRSPLRDSSTWFWPFGITVIHDREKRYREFGAPWPLVIFARGEGKHTSRVWPFYSRAQGPYLRSDFVLWPIYKRNEFNAPPAYRNRTRILFFLYSDIIEKNTETTEQQRRTDLWPFFTAKRDFSGRERLQIFAPIEPILPNNKSIERNYSPLWSVWRSEKNARTGAQSRSALWNLYRSDEDRESKKCSLLFGLFQYQSTPQRREWRLFYLPIRKSNPGR